MSQFDSMIKAMRKPKSILAAEAEKEQDPIRKAELEQAFEASKREYVGANEMMEALAILQELEKRKQYGGHLNWFRPGTPYGIDKLPKHKAFFDAGKNFKVRCIIAGNQVSKSTSCAFEMACHLTGIYPPFWEGKRFDKPVSAYALGISWNPQIKNGIQNKLLGKDGMLGTGMLDKNLIISTTAAPGIAGAKSSIQVQHVSGGVSHVNLLSYEQGIRAFQGAVIDLIWLDEEPDDYDIYSECMTRTVTTGGILMFSFTPQLGLTPLLTQLYRDATLLCGADPLPIQAMALAEADDPEKFRSRDKGAKANVAIVQIHQDDAPWIPQEEIEMLWNTTSPHLREARRYGRVTIGEGTIYPISIEDLIESPFEIPRGWKRTYGLDVGFAHGTAAQFVAQNPDTGVVYVYYEHFAENREPLFHAEAIKRAGGTWMTGSVDYDANKTGRGGENSLTRQYTKHGLKLVNANKKVEAGIWAVWELMVTGKLKIFSNCQHLLKEIPIYRRDKDGKVVKKHDNNLDALRYAIMGLSYAKTPPIQNAIGSSGKPATFYKEYSV